MTSEPILIVDETPANLKLTRLVLAGAGYDVRTAQDAEEALQVLRAFRPRLILTDIRLPGMDGLELTRRLKTDPATRNTVIVALTGCALETDQRKAKDAGFDGYITKPFDTRSLPAVVEQHLARGTTALSAGQSEDAAIAFPEFSQSFLTEGAEQSRKLLESLPSGLDIEEAKEIVRRWKGLGGVLGHPQISRLAQQVERLLKRPPPEVSAQLRDTLNQLFLLFTQQPPKRREAPVLAPPLRESLSGKRVALAGFDPDEARRMSEALGNARAMSEILEFPEITPQAELLASFDLLIFNFRHSHKPPAWLKRKSLARISKPVLFVGPRDLLLDLDVSLKNGGHDFLIWPWDAEEAVMRACLALSRSGNRREQPKAAPAKGKPSIVIADDDPTTVALVKATLESYEMECRVAKDGGQALEMIAAQPPSAIILDVNMPNLDGFEVLAALKQEEATSEVPVIFLTARQQETDIVRGFGLGADDYVVKPFSPMELVARLKRLLRKEP